jgi:hypothetical protein
MITNCEREEEGEEEEEEKMLFDEESWRNAECGGIMRI